MMEDNLPLDLVTLRQKAWIGDAVLSLCAREWLLATTGLMCSERFIDLTSNAFLSTLGNPTKIEAQIGILYERDGLEAARAYFLERIIPQYLRQERNRRRRKVR